MLNTPPLNARFKNKSWDASHLLILCLGLFPILTLTLRGWASGILLLAFLLSLYAWVKDKKNAVQAMQSRADAAWMKRVFIAMAAPLIAIFLGQLFRQQFTWPDYDSPSRFLLAIPIALFIIRRRINAVRLMEYAVPAAVFIAAASVWIYPEYRWGKDRMTTYFVDPLTFGSICLTFALMSLVSVDVHKKDAALAKLIKYAAFALGLYLSFMSGSRTGWMALPIVLWLWLRFKHDVPHWVIFAAIGFFCAAIYFSVPVVRLRVDIAAQEILLYRWNHVNENTSVGLRISFIRIGWYLFTLNPLGGWGDQGFKHVLNAPELQQFATAFAGNFALSAGFHNEIITNMVRSGIWGLMGSMMLLSMPLAFFIKGLHSESVGIRRHALLALSYFVCVIVSSMSTEVFNLKYTASFHAMMLASFSGTLFALMRKDPTSQSL